MKYDGYIIYSDLDGTIRGSDGKISEKNREKLKTFMENGGRFALATGRGVEHALKLELEFNAPLVAVNGTYIYDVQKGECIAKFPMENCKDDYLYAYKNYNFERLVVCYEDEVRNMSDIPDNYEELFLRPVLKIVYIFSKEADALKFQNEMSQKYSDKYVFERSWSIGVEMLCKNAGKGACVDIVREYLKGKIHTVICVGDFENDISMIRTADIGVAMGNAIESVKNAADVTGPDNNSDAIAWIIDNLCCENKN